jgi:hypothetical protein
LRRSPSMRPGRRRFDQIQRGLGPRVDSGHASRRGAARRAVDLGATEMPLDGGAPTLRWTRAPARGLAVVPLAPDQPPLLGLLARAWKKEAPGGRRE